MQLVYYNVFVDSWTSDKELEVFAALRKYRLFTPHKDYRLAGLWRSCLNRDHSAEYHMAVAYENGRPVGVMVYEPNDGNFVSFFVSVPWRGKGLATKLATFLMDKCKYPEIWCMGKAKSVMSKIGYVSILGKRTMYYPQKVKIDESGKGTPLYRLWKRTESYFRKPRLYQ